MKRLVWILIYDHQDLFSTILGVEIFAITKMGTDGLTVGFKVWFMDNARQD